uniref:DUF6535 domain-containing protein n=1 Tax=Schizophyllum commune (strain H4-8 / FGSC 9210) TaxID=578458 RepID=D8Q5E5_SCHCM
MPLPDEIPSTTSPEAMTPVSNTSDEDQVESDNAGTTSERDRDAPSDSERLRQYERQSGKANSGPQFEGRRGHLYKRSSASDVDYERKYAPDPYGEEVGDSARVWRVYNDEAQMVDAEMVEGLNGTLDVLLVFAGLFSGVVTTFVSESSQALNPDYAQISASLLFELTRMQRAMSSGLPITEVPRSQYSMNSETQNTSDVWVNGLWLTSLVFALATAFITVLAKQWLQHYASATGGSLRDRAYVRQYRLWSFTRWNVPFIIDFLPILLNIALLLFLAGLAVYVAPMNASIAHTIISFTALIFLAYAVTIILPIWVPHCAYKTSISDYMIYIAVLLARLSRFFMDFLYHAVRLRHALCRSPRRMTKLMFAEIWNENVREPMHAKERMSLKSREMVDVSEHRDFLTAEVIVWLCFSSLNTSAASIAVQAVAGLPIEFRFTEPAAMEGLSVDVFHALQRECESEFDNWTNRQFVVDSADLIERLGRAILHFPNYPEISLAKLWDEVYAYRHEIMSPQLDALLRVMLLHRMGTGVWSPLRTEHTAYAADMTTFPTYTTDLHPLVWRSLYNALRLIQPPLLTLDPDILPCQTYAVMTCMWIMLSQENQEEPRLPRPDTLFGRTAIPLNHYCAWLPAREELLKVMERLISYQVSELEPLAVSPSVDVRLMRLFPMLIEFIRTHEPRTESQGIWATVGLDQMAAFLARRFVPKSSDRIGYAPPMLNDGLSAAAAFAAAETILTNVSHVSPWARPSVGRALSYFDCPSLYEIFCRHAGVEHLLCVPVGIYSHLANELVDALASYMMAIERLSLRRPLTPTMKAQTELLLDFEVLLRICEYSGLHGRNGLRALCRMSRGAPVWRDIMLALEKDRHRDKRRIMSCAIGRAIQEETRDGSVFRYDPDFDYVYLSGPELELHGMVRICEACEDGALRAVISTNGELHYGPLAVPWEFIVPILADEPVLARKEQLYNSQHLPAYAEATIDEFPTLEEAMVDHIATGEVDNTRTSRLALLWHHLDSRIHLSRRIAMDPGV